MGHPALEVVGCGVRYGSVAVFSDLNLRIEPGESVALVGPSGSGKSSLISCVTGMAVPQTGRVKVAGQDLSTMSPAGRARFRRSHLGLVFQGADLLPELSVEENVALILLFDGITRSRAIARAREVLGEVGLAEHCAKRTDEISGGQAQRVAVARALVRPEMRLLVADEPTASLDADNALRVMDLILDQSRAAGAGTLVATHDLAVAARCDRLQELRPTAVEALA